ncbi:hypothetical protein NKR19_g6931 [Coniochaeta hoffmannii]|uniref:Kinetochore protein mis14 n=1 Tax=Coniochaeta hoffmannii TaxID=91930 RepID=A0AA38RNY1_9PEZI|nr:hypothetical protein NKR19_g6931 [Coniochaeta hoffmannii]
METSPAHRKIELQSSEDLSYLISNVRRAAAAHINEAFPPVPTSSTPHDDGDGDELRTQIETLVDEYIARTFTLAAPNLTVNGLPVDDPRPYLSGDGGIGEKNQPEEQHEPFDGRKRDRVQALVAEEEALLSQIAALKRRVPQAAAAGWPERVRAGLEGDEAELAKRKEEVARAVRGEGRGVLGDDGDDGGVRPLERQGDVERAFAVSVGKLGRLKGDMPAAVAKMERARVAGEYVVTEL